MTKPYSPEREDLIVELYKSGQSIAKIAKTIGAGKNSVNRLLVRAGICKEKNIHKFDSRTEKEIATEYENGVSSRELCEKYQCCDTTIMKIAKNHHIKIRPKGGLEIPIADDIKQQILELWNKGLVKEQILRECNIKMHTYKFRRIMQELGISIEEIKSRRLEGENHHLWNGGRQITDQGYVLITIRSTDPYFCMRQDRKKNRGRILEHRYVMAQHLGRPLEVYESVHHIDGNRQNNDISNLQLRSSGHGIGQVCKCRNCGSTDIGFIPFD